MTVNRAWRDGSNRAIVGVRFTDVEREDWQRLAFAFELHRF
jgi:hypothetical protein